jgi:signal transduction histidine kinase
VLPEATAVGPALVLVVAAIAVTPLIVLGLTDRPLLRQGWTIGHWCLSAAAAAVAVCWSVRGTTGRVRNVRMAAAAALFVWTIGNVLWALFPTINLATFPSLGDVAIVAIVAPGIVVLGSGVRSRLSAAAEAAVYLDSAIWFVLIAALLLIAIGPTMVGLPAPAAFLALAYPTAFIGLGVAGLVGVLSVGLPIRWSGTFPLLLGTAIIGVAFAGWIVPIATGAPPPPLSNVLVSVGTLVAAVGAVTWQDELAESPGYLAFARAASRIGGPLVAGLLFLTLLLPLPAGVEPLVRVAVFAGGVLFITRQALLLRERTLMLAEVTRLTDENGRLVDELRNELDLRLIDQRRMIQASRAAAVGELAAGVAHEVNNPLTGVLGFAEILIEETPVGDPRRVDLETIRNEALRARAIVRALRDFANARSPELAPTDLSALVRATVDLVRFSIERRGVTIREDLADLPPILIDGSAIQQAVLNVLTNARQAVADDGRLEISVKADGERQLITITDDGIGMDADTALLAFDPFFSGRDAEPNVGPSMGLGLSVSHGLIESHGGTIRIDSRPGEGTTVEIRLPADGTLAGIVEQQGERGS